MSKLKIVRPTPEEDAEINTGITADPDNPELDDDFFANAIRVGDFASPEAAESFLIRRDKLASLAKDLGLSRNAWDALFPNNPGLEERFARMLEDAADKARDMAAEAVAAE